MKAAIDLFQETTTKCALSNVLLWTLLALGTLRATKLCLSFGSMLLDLLVLPKVDHAKYGARKGAYALITGASDGIGKQFALQYAEKGFNLLLVSRTWEKLETLKKDILIKYGDKIDVKILSIDFANDHKSNYDAIAELCGDLPVTILVNNVGLSHSIPVPFLETSEKELRDIITINNTATLLVTQRVAPLIKEHVKKLKCQGLILTMGSFSGLLPSPYLATYSGSKSFLQNWSNALSGELQNDNIDVQLVISYMVTSAMSKVKKTSMLIPNEKMFVRSALANVGRRVGAQERYGTITPYWSHALTHYMIENTVGVYSRLANSTNAQFLYNLRKRALRKAAKQEAASKQE